MVSLPPTPETVDLPGGKSATCYQVVDRIDIHLRPVGEVKVRLSGRPAGAALVFRLDPDGASRPATALARVAARAGQRQA